MLEVIQTILLLFLSFVAVRRMIRVAKRKKIIRAVPVIEGRGKREPMTQERKNELLSAIKEYFSDSVYAEFRLYLLNWLPEENFALTRECLQLSINKLLKFYAERLNDAIRVDEVFMKKMSAIKLNEIKDSYSEEDVQNLVSQIRKQLDDMREAKKKFWALHDTARDLGFETWGDVSYKVYMYLKP
jgi:hypothetical protein